MSEESIILDNVIPKPVFAFNFSTLMLFRCIQRNRAEQLLRGEIYFGSPQQWIDIEKRGKKGQGDLLEGVFLSTQLGDNSGFIKKLKTNPSLEYFDHSGFTFFRRKPVVGLRCLCLYGLRDNSFQKEVSSDGRAHYKTRITQKYFSSFTNDKTREEYEKADPQQQPVVVFINNPHVFFTRIREFLFSLDVKEEEIIISPVEYLNRYTRMVAAVPPPKELLLKDKTFEEQSEVRIIINSTSTKYLKYMRDYNNTLAVGSLEDITEIYNYYFDDMSIERYGSKGMMFSLPESRTFETRDLDFFELEELVLNILGGTVELTGLPENSDTWDKKLKHIADLFYSKYGVILHVDENKNIFLSNMSQELLNQSHERYKHLEKQGQFEKQIERLLTEGKINEACEDCLKALKDEQVSGAASYYLGKVYSLRGQYQEARDAFHKSFLRDYKRIESLDGVASTYFRCGEYEKAIDTYNAIQDEKGYDCRIWCNIGICYIRLKEYEKAIEYFDKGIAVDAKDAFPYYNKGVSLYMLKQYSQAKENMEKAIELDPQNEIYKQEYEKCMRHGFHMISGPEMLAKRP